MTSKTDFTAQEWSTLKQAPTLAGLWVSTAEPGGSSVEALSLAHSYGLARERAMQHLQSVDLIDQLVTEGPELDQNAFGTAGADIHSDAIAQAAPGTLHTAIDLLQRTASREEVDHYRRFVLELAQHVATAHKEGSHLGIGGTRISDREQAVLDGVAQALGAPAELS